MVLLAVGGFKDEDSKKVIQDDLKAKGQASRFAETGSPDRQIN
jgi:hypothetical protein